jgi:hypothetical protein
VDGGQGPDPTFAFGHGLSYTSFAYDNLKVSVEGSRLVASVDIRNTGKRAGADVAQLYLKLPAGSTTPIRLIGYDKVTLQPGEQRRIRIEAEPKTWPTTMHRRASGRSMAAPTRCSCRATPPNRCRRWTCSWWSRCCAEA